MKTGEDASVLGLYASECCGEELLFDRGDCFTRCPRCHGLTRWEMVDLVTACADIDTPAEAGIGVA